MTWKDALIMTELEKLQAHKRFVFNDPEIMKIKRHAAYLAQQFNQISEEDPEKQTKMARQILASAGDDLTIHHGFNFDNGKNIQVGDHFVADYNVTIEDVAEVTIGNNVYLGPNVSIYTMNMLGTAGARRRHEARVKPVTIGNDVWICGNAVIRPGVHIGDNSIIAAGAVVVHDVPANTMVAGVPAEVVQPLSKGNLN